MIRFPRKTGGLFNSNNVGNTPADVDYEAIDCMDTDLMKEMTQSDTVISPTLFDFDSLPDNCTDSELTLDADNDLLDSVSLEEFMDLAEFLDLSRSTLSADNLVQVTSDVVDVAGRVHPLLPPASATSSSTTDATSLPVPAVFSTLSDDASTPELSVDHTYYHPARRKDSNTKSSSAARHAQYLERRRKNNLACKRSRQAHKRQMLDMEEELGRLEQVNVGLRQRVMELEKAKQTLKSAVLDAFR